MTTIIINRTQCKAVVIASNYTLYSRYHLEILIILLIFNAGKNNVTNTLYYWPASKLKMYIGIKVTTHIESQNSLKWAIINYEVSIMPIHSWKNKN